MAKVFISHSSKDKDVVNLFKDIILKSGIGLTDKDIFYTSSPETGVPIGENIPQYIKDNLKECNFVFLMISDNYKKSEVCLNEMGAAMVLGNKYIPILLYNYKFDKVGWLIDRNLCIRIDDEERLDEIRDLFAKNATLTSTNVWNRSRNDFISYLAQKTKPNEDSNVKGLLDYQLDVKENQDIYKNKVEYINKIVPNYIKKAKYYIVKHNSSQNLQERKTALEELANILNNWADDTEKAFPILCESLKKSINTVEDILKIKTLSPTDKGYWVKEINNFLPNCEDNYEALADSKNKIEDLTDMLQSQIIAKRRLLNAYNLILDSYDSSIKKICEIVESKGVTCKHSIKVKKFL